MKKKTTTSLSLIGAIVLGTLVGCSGTESPQNKLVECYGVAKDGPDIPVMMTKGMCDKLPYTKQVTVNANDYVECYGVAAAGKNDCATNTSACGGTSSVNNASNAWIAIPNGVCLHLKGAVVGQLSSGASKKGSGS